MRPSEQARIEEALVEVGEQYAQRRAHAEEARVRLDALCVRAVRRGMSTYRVSRLSGLNHETIARAVRAAEQKNKETKS